jgi:type IV secretory pathway VirJ component
VLCVYGREERESLCPALAPGLAVKDERPGDHHLGGAWASIGARIAAEGKLSP